jgi:hypothetical protein
MSYKSLKFKITGVAPLIMHCGQTADPLNRFAKAMKRISGKKDKTEADYEELAKIEWTAGLYVKDGAPVLPGTVLEAALAVGARKTKKGKQVQAGVVCPDEYPIIYVGPAGLEELWADEAFRLTVGVRVQRNRVMRTRPIFREWSCEFEIMYDPAQLNESDVREIVKRTGEEVGLCDWRPKYGRFVVA